MVENGADHWMEAAVSFISPMFSFLLKFAMRICGRSVPLANKKRMTDCQETPGINLRAGGNKSASGCFRLAVVFSDFVAPISTVTLTERMKGPEIFSFHVSVILSTSHFRCCRVG